MTTSNVVIIRKGVFKHPWLDFFFPANERISLDIFRNARDNDMAYGKTKSPSWRGTGLRWVTPKRGVIRAYAKSYIPRMSAGRRGRSGGELKFHDIDVVDATLSAAGTILNGGSVVLIGQGVGESERVGRKCVIKSIQWRWNLNLLANSGSTAQPSETVRMILYKDKQCNGTAATASGVTGVVQSDDFQAFKNMENSSRFVILMDKTVTVNAKAGAGNGTANDFSTQHLNGLFYKSVNIPMEYSGSASPSVLGELRTNNIGILCFCKIGNILALDSKIRVKFSDG